MPSQIIEGGPGQAGSLGGCSRTGRWMRFAGELSQNDLMVSLLNAMSVADTAFGQRESCKGPLPRLT